MSLRDMHSTFSPPALDEREVASRMAELDGWTLAGARIERRFALRDYHQAIEFVNALAWMTHKEDHHPELTVTYNSCTVSYSTHSAGGKLTNNDFICAAKADALYAQRAGA